ncbi:MAG TPA: hypothetical protein VFP47_00970 [Pyrinomonadaceae bacterium]|jgi:hypothetical protein|nr:hypothetical protein [Pyrinomonadaceae bacterium]
MSNRLQHLQPIQIELIQRPDTEQERREIGFHIKEEARKYATRSIMRNGVH